MKPKFIFFTKTPWKEPPRIRHQLAWLLAASGYLVYFFEKPSNWPKRLSSSVNKDNGIEIMQHQELLHHKLRMSNLIHELNAILTIKSIRTRLHNIEISEDDVIVNFNYEYYFLRRVFFRNKIITIINDNFISRALFGYKKPLIWALKRCLKISDNVFTVSLPLKEDLEKYCKVELFMPWADRNYTEPKPDSIRKTLLFWGYINHRIDFELINKMLNDKRLNDEKIKILFVGPVDRSLKSLIARLEMHQNFQYQETTNLDRINLDEVIAGIIPYRENNPTINAITLSNKALQILARGLPFLIHGMPNFIKKPFVFRISKENVSENVLMLSNQFYSLQPIIRAYVAKNSGTARLKQLLNTLSQ